MPRPALFGLDRRDLTAEQRLVLALAAPDPDVAEVEHAAATCDVRELFSLARRHNLLPLAIHAAGSGTPHLARLLESDERFAALRRQFLFLDRIQVIVLGDLIRWFGAGGVPFLLLKGLGLAEALYSNPLQRVGVDIDLLVRREELDSAAALLAAEGFSAVHPEFYKSTHFHLPFVRSDRKLPITIEVHWELSPARSPVQFDPRGWWDRARGRSLRAGAVHVPPADVEIVHLAWHAFNKGAATLRDLGEIARARAHLAGTAEAESVRQIAERSGAGGFAERAELLAEAYWGTPRGSQGEVATRSRLQRRIANRILAPARVLRLGAERRSTERRLSYWSLLARDRTSLGRLFAEVAREAREPAPDSTEKRGVRHAIGETARLGLALVQLAWPGER